jgi:glycosyltransferase involved in cell wall biosynthesis
MIRVSTIIPTRNRPQLLREALQSVVEQELPEMEVIVVDDASETPDVNAAVVRSFEDRLDIRCIRLPHRGGTGRARNAGIQAARGEYIAQLDDDDLWHPGKLHKQLDRFQRNPRCLPNLGVVYVWHQWVDVETGHTRVRRARLESLDDLWTWSYNIPQTVLIRRDCFEATGPFDEQMPTKQDFDLLARMILSFQFDAIEEVLVTCRTHRGPRRTDDFRARLRGQEILLERYGPLVRDPRVLHDARYRFGRLLLSAGEPDRARHELRRALALAPAGQKARYFAFLALAAAAAGATRLGVTRGAAAGRSGGQGN